MLSYRQQLARRKWGIWRMFCRFSHVAILTASMIVEMDHPTKGECPAVRARLSSWCVVHSVGAGSCRALTVDKPGAAAQGAPGSALTA